MTPLKNLWPSSPAKAEPGLDKPVRAFLTELCRDPAAHGRFLNTLSLMEHIGSRKIMVSQSGPGLNEDTLRHLAEEARHAHFFRRAGERVAARALGYGAADVLAPASARMYMGRLDALITRELGPDRPLAYPYVTLAVELRAGWLYGIYDSILRAASQPVSLSGVLAEESGHLQNISDALQETDPLYEPRRTVFIRLEEPLFAAWLSGVRRAAFPGRDQSELPL